MISPFQLADWSKAFDSVQNKVNAEFVGRRQVLDSILKQLKDQIGGLDVRLRLKLSITCHNLVK